MKQLIVNNKLNMDICVLLGCYEQIGRASCRERV